MSTTMIVSQEMSTMPLEHELRGEAWHLLEHIQIQKGALEWASPHLYLGLLSSFKKLLFNALPSLQISFIWR